MTAIFAPHRVSIRVLYGLGALAAILFGYDNGIIAAAILYIPDEIALSSLTKGVVVSGTVAGALVGALIGGPLADRRGRNGALLAAGVVFGVGAAGTALAGDVAELIVFRVALGLGIGVASVVVPLYLAEMAPATVRGSITSLNQYMIVIGTALAAAAGYLLAPAAAWRWMIGIGVVPAVVLVAGAVLLPDTPRSLVRRGRSDRARTLLERLRDDPATADAELAEITALERERSRANGSRAWSRPWIRRLLLLGVVMAAFQQITGVNAIVYYSPTTLTEFGLSDRDALLFSLINGVINIVSVAVVVRRKLVDRRGRRPVLLTGVVIMLASMVLVGVGALVLPAHSTALLAVSVVAFVVFTNAFSATWGPVLWVVLAEIFPLAVRGTAMALATAANWLTNVAVALLFPIVADAVGAGAVFLFFALMGVIVFVVVRAVLPETRERSLEQLETGFRGSAGPEGGQP